MNCPKPGHKPKDCSFKSKTSEVVSVHRQQQKILFRIIPVIKHANVRSVQTFAFLDSDITLLERFLAEQLDVECPTSPPCIKWTNRVKRVEEEVQKIQLDVQTIEGLELSRQSVHFEELSSNYPHLRGLPVQSYNDAVPGILISLGNTRLKTTLKLRENMSRL